MKEVSTNLREEGVLGKGKFSSKVRYVLGLFRGAARRPVWLEQSGREDQEKMGGQNGEGLVVN